MNLTKYLEWQKSHFFIQIKSLFLNAGFLYWSAARPLIYCSGSVNMFKMSKKFIGRLRMKTSVFEIFLACTKMLV